MLQQKQGESIGLTSQSHHRILGTAHSVATSGLHQCDSEGQEALAIPCAIARGVNTGRMNRGRDILFLQSAVMLSHWDHDRNAEHRVFQEDITLCSNKPSPPDVPAVLARHRWVAVPNAHFQNQRGGPDCSRSAACRCNPFATHCSNPLCKNGIPARTRQHQC